jgi:molecular chaperone DnaK
MLREQGDKISGGERGDVESAVADAKKALESGEAAQMIRATENLNKASHKLAEAMYKAASTAGAADQPGTDAQTPPPGSNGHGAPKNEGVIDAEYVDVEEKK